MNRVRCFLAALVLGTVAVGPVVTFASFILEWPLGLTSSYAFTGAAGLTAGYGALLGLISALACGATGCRPWASGLWSGAAVFALTGALTVVMALRGAYSTVGFGQIAGVLISSLTAVAIAYLTACLAIGWENRQAQRATQPPKAQPSGQRFRL